MTVQKLLMTPAYFKRHTVTDENVNSEYITPLIELCQDTFVQELLGTGLYDELLSQIPNSLSSNNQTLMNKVLPAMKWWVEAKLIRRITYKMGNVGMKEFEDENYLTPTSNTIDSMESEYMNWAEYYANRVTLFLIENSTTYPLFDNPGDGIDKVHPNRNQFRTSIFLGGRKGKGCNDIDVDMGDRWHVCKK
jgi:hypothetical protein